MFDDGLPRLDRAALSAVAGMLGAVSSTYCVCVRACVFPLSLEPSILLPSSLLDPSRAYTIPYLPPSVLPPFPRAHPFLGQENTSQENKAISRPGWTPRTYHGELNWGGGGGEGRRWRGVMRWGKGSSVTVCPCICIYGGGVIGCRSRLPRHVQLLRGWLDRFCRFHPPAKRAIPRKGGVRQWYRGNVEQLGLGEGLGWSRATRAR